MTPTLQTLEIDITDDRTARVRATGDTLTPPPGQSIFETVGDFVVRQARTADQAIPVAIRDTSGNQKVVIANPDGHVDVVGAADTADIAARPATTVSAPDELDEDDPDITAVLAEGPVKVSTASLTLSKTPTTNQDIPASVPGTESEVGASPPPATSAPAPSTAVYQVPDRVDGGLGDVIGGGGGTSMDDTREMPRITDTTTPPPTRAATADAAQTADNDEVWDRAIAMARANTRAARHPTPATPSSPRTAAVVPAAIGSSVTRTAGALKAAGRQAVSVVTTQKGRRIAIAATFLGLILAVTVAGASVLFGGGDDTAVSPTAIPAQNRPASPSPSAAAADADCPNRTDGAITTGRDAGGTTTGPAIIKAFDYAYYVLRSGVAARATGTPTANLGTPDAIQQTINAVPSGTRHCLRIEDKGAGSYAVTLTQQPPGGGAPTIYSQQIQTVAVDGHTLIAQIPHNENVSVG